MSVDGDSPRVAVLGATGMLGSMTLDHLAAHTSLELIATTRRQPPPSAADERFARIDWRRLDATAGTTESLREILADCDWAINAIGITKPYIDDDNPREVERALLVNSLFPQQLARAAEQLGCRVLQIATDCVYSGQGGGYDESQPHDAHDAYGKTKSLGEVRSPALRHLRTSIIGPETKAHAFLLAWFLGQERGAELRGFRNHQWNGVTTLHFARVCHGIIRQGLDLPHLHHLVPGSSVSKLELLRLFARSFGRDDLTIHPVDAGQAVDRSLTTGDEELNRILWAAAGYADPPSVAQMIDELARHDFPSAETAP